MAGVLQPPGLHPWLKFSGDASRARLWLRVDHEPVLGPQLPSFGRASELPPILLLPSIAMVEIQIRTIALALRFCDAILIS